MDIDQSASADVEAVTEGQADTFLSLTRRYPGGKKKLQLAMGHPDVRKDLWTLLDRLAAERERLLPVVQRDTWMRLVCTCDNAQDYLNDLKSGGCLVSVPATTILQKVQAFPVVRSQVHLVRASVLELTGKTEATTEEVLEGVRKAGGHLVSFWVGAELRKQYREQPEGEHLALAMEVIHQGSIQSGQILCVCNERQLELCTFAGETWPGDQEFVFERFRTIGAHLMEMGKPTHPRTI